MKLKPRIKNKSLVSNLLAQLEKRELEEALGSYSKTQMPDVSDPVEREKLRLSNTVPAANSRTQTGPGPSFLPGPSTIATGLKNIADPYAREKIVPHLFNTDVMKKFGSISADQQHQLQQNAAGMQDKIKQTNWTQYFYSDILTSKAVKLSTFIVKHSNRESDKHPAAESFYTNYVVNTYEPLFESGYYNTSFGDRAGETLYLNSGEQARAYLRVPGSNDFFIGSSSSGLRYIDFTQAKLNVRTEEAMKVSQFATSILETVRNKVIADLSEYFKNPTERAFLESLKSGQLPLVFLDSLMFGLVDVLNLPLGQNYGNQNQAAEKLKASPLINNNMFGESLLQSNPPAAEAITSRLTTCSTHTNPFVLDIGKLKSVVSKTKTPSTLYNAFTNVIFGNFGNLLAKINASCGVEKFDFSGIMSTWNTEEKISTMYSLVDSGQLLTEFSKTTTSVPNPFIRIIFIKYTPNSSNNKYVYLIHPVNVSGLAYATAEKSKSNEPFSTYAQTADWKGLGISSDQHEYILNKAKQETGNISASSYCNVLASMDTKGDTSQNAYAGREVSAAQQLLRILSSLYNEDDGSFYSNHVLFATIPRLILEGAKYDIYSSDSRIINIPDVYKLSFMKNKDAAGNPINTAELGLLTNELGNFVSLRTICDQFMEVMYNFNTKKEEINILKERFKILAENLASGYWTLPEWSEKGWLGLLPLLQEHRGDLRITESYGPIGATDTLEEARIKLLNEKNKSKSGTKKKVI